MDLILGVVADAANQGEGGKLNVLGIFQDVLTVSLPCVVPHMALAISLRARQYDRGKNFEVKVPLLDPDAKVLFEIGTTLSVPLVEGHLEPVTSVTLNLFNVALAKAGTHKFEVRVDGDRKGQIKLNVQQVPIVQVGGGNGGA